MRHSFVLLITLSLAASAQVVSVGIKGGVPVTDIPRLQASPWFSYPGISYADTGRWTVGPTIEFHLPARLSIEVDALFRGYRGGSGGMGYFLPNGQTLFVTAQQEVKAVDFPILLKYRFPGQTLRPFVSLGGTATHESVDGHVNYSCVGTESCYPDGMGPFLGSQYSNSNTLGGYTGGGGVEFRFHRVRIAPELRYTRFHRPASNQVSLLVGLSF